MKIAVVTDDGKTICQHFGRAQYYLVASAEDGSVTGKEQRPKAGHHVAGMNHEHTHAAGACHGFNAHAQATHAGMVSNITDSQLVIAGGMGQGAQESLKQAGIAVHMTDVADIETALKLYLEGKLPNLTDRLH
ncbi:MAG: NifB/NifX family molybdenum-iron cluster-binding protein [Candidatus Doudnabacteria bacterium]|jgi:predicted Fe-Mo cluster-binding NifX family protein